MYPPGICFVKEQTWLLLVFRIKKLVDDILIMGENKEELLERMEKLINHCHEQRITLNDRKIQVGQSVKFGGHIITNEGSSPDPEKVQAIKDFPTPTNVTDTWII